MDEEEINNLESELLLNSVITERRISLSNLELTNSKSSQVQNFIPDLSGERKVAKFQLCSENDDNNLHFFRLITY